MRFKNKKLNEIYNDMCEKYIFGYPYSKEIKKEIENNGLKVKQVRRQGLSPWVTIIDVKNNEKLDIPVNFIDTVIF